MEITREDFDTWRYMLLVLYNLDISPPRIQLSVKVTPKLYNILGEVKPNQYNILLRKNKHII